MSTARSAWLVGGVLWLGHAAHAQTQLQVCPAALAPTGVVQAEIVQPTGAALRAVVTPVGPVTAGCTALPLASGQHRVLALRPVAAPVARALAQGVSLSGPAVDGQFSISEVTPRTAASSAVAVPASLPLATELLPLLATRTFGAEARASVQANDRGLLLRCAAGRQPAGVVLSSDRPLPQQHSALQLRSSGQGQFQLNSVDARDASREAGTPLGTVRATGLQRLTTQDHPLPDDARHRADWRHWTLACPAGAAQLQLHSVRLVVPSAHAAVPARATWVWQPTDWRDRPQAVLALAQRHHIRTLFVTVPLASGAVLAPTELQRFIRQARSAGLVVWAVDGDPRMVLPGEHANATARASAYARYNQNAPSGARLAGVQFDVEPYLLPGYDLATEAWERHYTALVAALQAGADGLPLEMVVPFWWGDKPTLLDAVAPRVSGLTVMAYRTRTDEITRLAQPFLEWGMRQNKPVRIALEAGPVAPETLRHYAPQASGELWQLRVAGQDYLLLLAEPAANPHGPAFQQVGSALLSGSATTFHGQPHKLLEMLPTLEAQFATWPAFGGMALHEIQ